MQYVKKLVEVYFLHYFLSILPSECECKNSKKKFDIDANIIDVN